MRPRATALAYALRRQRDGAWLSLRQRRPHALLPLVKRVPAPYQTLATVRWRRLCLLIARPRERIEICYRDPALSVMVALPETAERQQRLATLSVAMTRFCRRDDIAAFALDGLETLLDRRHAAQMRYYVVLLNVFPWYIEVTAPHPYLTRLVHCHRLGNRYLVRDIADLAMLRLCDQFRPWLIYDFETGTLHGERIFLEMS